MAATDPLEDLSQVDLHPYVFAPSTYLGSGGVAGTQAAMLDGGIDSVSDSEHPVLPQVEGVFVVAAADGRPRLLVSICRACGARFFPPRERCSACSEASMRTVEAPPQGELYTWTVIRELGGLREGFEPYVIGQVDLDEGPRVTGIVKCDPEKLQIGMRLRVCLISQDWDLEGRELVGYGFEPAREDSA